MSVAKFVHTMFPQRIDLQQLNDAFNWQGEIAFARFSRLSSEVEQTELGLDVDSVSPVTVNCKVSVNEELVDSEVIWLSLVAEGTLPQQCQRCLHQVDTPMQVDIKMALLTDEATADALDDDADFIVLNEAHGLTQQDDALSVDLLRVIEDELLLTLPISPMHDDCNMAVTQVGEIIEETPEDNPFAQLAALKGTLGSGKQD